MKHLLWLKQNSDFFLDRDTFDSAKVLQIDLRRLWDDWLLGNHEIFDQSSLLQERDHFMNHYFYQKNGLDLSFVNRKNLENTFEDFNFENLQSIWELKSSGTSGKPVKMYFDDLCHLSNFYLNLEKTMHIAGISPSDNKENFLFQAVFLSDNPKYQKTYIPHIFEEWNPSLIIPVRSQEEENWKKLFAFLKANPSRVLSSKPVILSTLVEYLNKNPETEIPSFDLIISSGSQLSVDLRSQVESMLGTRVISSYNTTEFGYVASECLKGSMHIDHSRLFVEEKLNELFITSFDNKAVPLLRYQIGDMGILSNDLCSCGRAGPVIQSLQGRTSVIFNLNSDQKVSSTVFMDIFTRFPILKEFQLTQIQATGFILDIELRENAYFQKSNLENYFKVILGENIRIQTNHTQFNSNDKHVRYKVDLTL